MKDSILFVSVKSVPMIEYSGIQIILKDYLSWRDKLKGLGVDLMKVIVYANRDLFSAFLRSALYRGVAVMKSSESIIPFSSNRAFPIEEQLEFAGFNIFEDGQTEFDENNIVMKVFVYEVYNDYYLNKGE